MFVGHFIGGVLSNMLCCSVSAAFPAETTPALQATLRSGLEAEDVLHSIPVIGDDFLSSSCHPIAAHVSPVQPLPTTPPRPCQYRSPGKLSVALLY